MLWYVVWHVQVDEDALDTHSGRPHVATGIAVEDGFAVSFVVTGVALNGFARYAGACVCAVCVFMCVCVCVCGRAACAPCVYHTSRCVNRPRVSGRQRECVGRWVR